MKRFSLSLFAGIALSALAASVSLAQDMMINLSARGVTTPNDPLILGYIVDNGDRKVLLRASGSTLATKYSVPGALTSKVQLEVYDQQSHLNIWTQTSDVGYNPQKGKAGADQIPYDSAGFAAMFKNLNLFAQDQNDCAYVYNTPGFMPTTCVVRSADLKSSGTVLAEFYDLPILSKQITYPPPWDSSNPAVVKQWADWSIHFVNISARAQVGNSDDSILIVGFIITTHSSNGVSMPVKIMIRGYGPVLQQFGVPTPNSDVELTLYDGSSKVIAHNDDWEGPIDQVDKKSVLTTLPATANSQKATAGFSFPAGSKDAAMIVELVPGAYTVIMRGKKGALGTGLVELNEDYND